MTGNQNKIFSIYNNIYVQLYTRTRLCHMLEFPSFPNSYCVEFVLCNQQSVIQNFLYAYTQRDTPQSINKMQLWSNIFIRLLHFTSQHC